MAASIATSSIISSKPLFIAFLCLLIAGYSHCEDAFSGDADGGQNIDLGDNPTPASDLNLSTDSESDIGTTDTDSSSLPNDDDVEEARKIDDHLHKYVPKDFYSFSVKSTDGTVVSLEKYRGQVTLVVNVASECGYTDSHYKSLIRLRNVLSPIGQFEVLAFPCNQFGAQEPGPIEDIVRFLNDIYHVNFPVFDKVNVLDDNVPEAWQYLIAAQGQAPNWNFWKYLVDGNGHVLNAWGPRTSVEDIFHVIRQEVINVGFSDQASPRHDDDQAPHRHGGEL